MKKKSIGKKTKFLLTGIIGILVIVLIILIASSKEGNVEYNVKSTLSRLVEKSDLETVDFTYNVIAKQCKKKGKCDKKSNNINDFEYVISCKGNVTVGIDFKDVKVKVEEEKKILSITLPDAKIKEINVLSKKFMNGDDVPADELANAEKLCNDTVNEKSENDKELLTAAKEQAQVVLESFYSQWIKAYNDEYKVEVK